MPNVDKLILNNPERLHLLNKLNLLKAEENSSFDRATRLVSHMLAVPISLVSIIDDTQEWAIGGIGLPSPYDETRQLPLDYSICQHVVASKAPLIIENTREDARLADNLAVLEYNALAYLGIPIIADHDVVIGSFCVIDTQTREWTDSDIFLMVEIAANIMNEIKLRSELQKRHDAEMLLTDYIRDREQMRIVKQMTQAISHDLRTPLSSVQVKFELLARQIQDEKGQQKVEQIRDKLDEVKIILNSFTMLWSVDSHDAISKSRIDLHTIIDYAVQGIEESATYNQAKTTITLNLLADHALIIGQAQLITVMLNNLLENAIIYGNSDITHITITTSNHNNEIHLSIQDNGIGIPEDNLSNIFEPLFKVNAARTSNKSLSGLGLTVARQIAEEHHGDISVNSQLAVGSEFIITLPLLSQDNE